MPTFGKYEFSVGPILWLELVTVATLCRACLKHGIPLREVAPLWSQREQWEEAFITSKF